MTTGAAQFLLKKGDKEGVFICTLTNIKSDIDEPWFVLPKPEVDMPRPVSRWAARLGSKIEKIFELAGDEDREALQKCFSDAQLISIWTGGGGSGTIQCQGNISESDSLYAAAVFFQGIFRFLQGDDHYLELDAALIMLYAVWQWYNALKLVLDLEGDHIGDLESEFSLAYRTLVYHLKQKELSSAVSYLAAKVGAPTESIALARLRLQLSMVLKTKQETGKPGFNRPIAAPGLAADQSISWHQVEIPKVFQQGQQGRAAVRRLIRNQLLPHYDLESAFWLARLLEGKSPTREIPFGLHWFGIGGLVVFLFIALAVSVQWLPGLTMIPCAGLAVEWATLIALGCIAYRVLDIGSIPHLALPRVLGGILIGYFAVALQPPEFIRYLCQGNGLGILPVPGLIAMLWVGVALLSFGYLLADVHFMTETSGSQKKRALFTLVYAIMATIVLGIFILPLVGNPCLEGQCLLFTHSLQPMSSACSQGYLIGPLGLVHIKTLFAFVPMALLAGLISQFIWEREPITASIWAPGEE